MILTYARACREHIEVLTSLHPILVEQKYAVIADCTRLKRASLSYGLKHSTTYLASNIMNPLVGRNMWYLKLPCSRYYHSS